LDDFEEDKGLGLPMWPGAHSSFGGGKYDGVFDFKAVKHSYDGRCDEFKFERVE
jgi:hypothetical protein